MPRSRLIARCFFFALTRLVGGVVLGKYASMNAGYKNMEQQLRASSTAVWEKLQRVELRLVQQLVRHSCWQTVQTCKDFSCVVKDDRPCYTPRILGGNWI